MTIEHKIETITKGNDPIITAKSCSYADIGNILVSSGSKAIFIDGVASVVLLGYFVPPQLTLANVAIASSAAFVSYTIREYATKCLNDAQYPGGVVGGILKYSIKSNNPAFGAINNLGYEFCNYHKLNGDACVITLEAGEEVAKHLLGMDQISVTSALLNGIIISATLITSVNLVYLPLDQHVKAALNFTAEEAVVNVTIPKNQCDVNFEQSSNYFSNSVCLLGEDDTA